MSEMICNVCRKLIVIQAEQVDRVYKIKANGRQLPPQKKHASCDAAYAAEKTGLEKVAQ
jgi:hypothetical protein